MRTAPAQTNPPPVAQKLDQPQKSDDRKDSKELSKDPKDQSKLKSPIKVKSVASETMTSPLQPSEPEVPVDKAFQNFVKTERRKNKDAGETINELKKFSKEFKLKTPVPSDIQEMYSKKKTEEEGKKEFKLNPKAVEFKPNPNAAPFVPVFLLLTLEFFDTNCPYSIFRCQETRQEAPVD